MTRNRTRAALFAAMLAVLGAAAPPLPAAVELDAGLQTLATTLAGQMRGKGIAKLAVVDFTDIRGYPSALDAYLAEKLITQLFTSAPGEFSIVERRQLARVLEEQRLTASAIFDQNAVAEIGRVLGIDAIVTGSIADLGDVIEVNARSISVETGNVFAAAGAEITKQGRVAELLRQTAGPGREFGAAPAAPATRQVQASDVFFENKLLRVTVASVGVSPGRDQATIALQVENLSPDDLKLSLVERMQHCAATLTDEVGNHSQIRPSQAGGVSCTSENSMEHFRRGSRLAVERGPIDQNWPVLASRARTTWVLPFRASSSYGRGRAEIGRLLSVGLELYVSRGGGRIETVSVGLANIQAPASAEP